MLQGISHTKTLLHFSSSQFVSQTSCPASSLHSIACGALASNLFWPRRMPTQNFKLQVLFDSSVAIGICDGSIVSNLAENTFRV